MQTRNTVQRQIVLQAVLRMHDHPTADTVYAAVAADHPSISKATVYRNLNQLASQGRSAGWQFLTGRIGMTLIWRGITMCAVPDAAGYMTYICRRLKT